MAYLPSKRSKNSSVKAINNLFILQRHGLKRACTAELLRKISNSNLLRIDSSAFCWEAHSMCSNSVWRWCMETLLHGTGFIELSVQVEDRKILFLWKPILKSDRAGSFTIILSVV